MDGATTLMSPSSHFPITSKDFLPQAYRISHGTPSARKRKPIVTYQSPGSGVVDVELLVRNTALEIEAAVARSKAVSMAATAAAAAGSVSPTPAIAVEHTTPDATTHTAEPATTTTPRTVHRPLTIPRPPRPLYHPLSRPGTSKPAAKSSSGTSSSASQLAPPAAETGRRSSSRTRRPAPKMRDTESSIASIAKNIAQEKPSPPKRRRGPAAGRRRRGAGQLDADGDGTYPSGKRTRKRVLEVDVENETMPPPTMTNGASPPSGYSTRAKRPRKAAHARGESSTSDGTGSATRTTPVNGPVEEFWVPTKSN